jgi:hypothetical protein
MAAARAKRAARGAGARPQPTFVRFLDLGMGDQVVEDVGAPDGVDVVLGPGAELVLDLALLDHFESRGCVRPAAHSRGLDCPWRQSRHPLDGRQHRRGPGSRRQP